jgi:hypothetical protein
MEAVMRLFSWAGCAALAASAGVGFFAGQSINQHDPIVIQVCDAGGELCDAPPATMSPPKPVEEIDLSCPTSPPMPPAFVMSQSMEPPLADPSAEPDMIRTASFELPAAAPVGLDEPPTMPYLTDDGEPAPLPPLGDVPLLTPPTSNAGNPIYQAVKKFVDGAGKLPEAPADENLRARALANQAEDLRRANADWKRIWFPDAPASAAPITDKVPIGTPPVSEHPSAVKPEKPAPQPQPKTDTTEIRPGDAPRGSVE